MSARSFASAALAAVDVACLVVIAAGVTGPARYAAGLLTVLVIPGWAVVSMLPLANLALELALTPTIGLALTVLGAQSMLALHSWHPRSLALAILALSLPTLLWSTPATRAVTGIHRRGR